MRVDQRFGQILLICGLFLVIGSAPSWAKSKASMTNQNVINLVKIGIPERDILTTIATYNTSFSLTDQDLRRLKREGVSQKIIDAMIEKQNMAPSQKPAQARRRTSQVTSPPQKDSRAEKPATEESIDNPPNPPDTSAPATGYGSDYSSGGSYLHQGFGLGARLGGQLNRSVGLSMRAWGEGRVGLQVDYSADKILYWQHQFVPAVTFKIGRADWDAVSLQPYAGAGPNLLYCPGCADQFSYGIQVLGGAELGIRAVPQLGMSFQMAYLSNRDLSSSSLGLEALAHYYFGRRSSHYSPPPDTYAPVAEPSYGTESASGGYYQQGFGLGARFSPNTAASIGLSMRAWGEGSVGLQFDFSTNNLIYRQYQFLPAVTFKVGRASWPSVSVQPYAGVGPNLLYCHGCTEDQFAYGIQVLGGAQIGFRAVPQLGLSTQIAYLSNRELLESVVGFEALAHYYFR
jgi:hypothetical protein